MARVEKSVEINASPREVWQLLTWEKVPEWCDPIKRVEWASEGKMEVGATVHVFSEIGGLKGEWDAETTELVTNQSLSWRTASGGPTIICHANMVPTKTGSRVTTGIDYDLPYAVLGETIDRLRVHKTIEREVEKALKKMKNMAEINWSKTSAWTEMKK